MHWAGAPRPPPLDPPPPQPLWQTGACPPPTGGTSVGHAGQPARLHRRAAQAAAVRPPAVGHRM